MLSPSELWRYREVAIQIATRDITVRYRQTVFGALWAILQPVATIFVVSTFVGKLAHLPWEGRAYPVSSLAGLVPWTFFANALLLGSDSLVSNSMRVANTYFHGTYIPAGVCRGPRRARDRDQAWYLVVATLSWRGYVFKRFSGGRCRPTRRKTRC